MLWISSLRYFDENSNILMGPSLQRQDEESGEEMSKKMFYYRILVPEEAVLTSKARLVGLLQNNQVYYHERSLTVPYF
jgi:hypothetical protein